VLLGATVLLTARDLDLARAAAACLGSRGGRVEPLAIDVSSGPQVAAAGALVRDRFGRLDILVNNAGAYLDDPRGRTVQSACDLPAAWFSQTLDINVVGAFRLVQEFLPLMKERGYGRIVNVSSGMGRTVELDRHAPFYRTSKAALNALTRILADEVTGYDIRINAVCPGWVRTRMGGKEATRSVKQGARGIVQAVLIHKGGFNGHLLRDGERFGW
jgi:NAD(P)-dependent dehydrogenase (short-subunit alcohol dehydrogenase family)